MPNAKFSGEWNRRALASRLHESAATFVRWLFVILAFLHVSINPFFLHSFIEICSFFIHLLKSILSLPVFVVYFLFFIYSLVETHFLFIFVIYSFFIHLLKFIFYTFLTFILTSLVYQSLLFTHLLKFALSFTCLSGSALSSLIYWSLLFLHPFFAVYSFFTCFLKSILSSFVSYNPSFFICSLLPYS